MGGYDAGALASVEPLVKYHPVHGLILTLIPVNPGNGQCQLGSLTGAVSSQRVTEEPNRYPQPGWQSGIERKGRRVLNCETYQSSRYESRA